MKKERIFYLDFVRAIATIAILLTHYNALYVYMADESVMNKVVLTSRVANLYIGDFGVSLFLIISGASLMYVYQDRLELGNFYKKRFWNIYPMFWIAFFAAFMHSFWKWKGLNSSTPKINILLSVIGMDGYLSTVVPTFYKVGEWFLGFIIIMYVVFPLLRICVLKFPKITVICTMIVYIISHLFYSLPLTESTFLLTRLPEIIFGMLFVVYMKKVKTSWFIVSLLVIAANTILQPAWSSNIQTTYVGIASFLVLTWLATYVGKISVVQSICKTVSKYSYAIFLVHHYIIYEICEKFPLQSISVLESYLLFLLCCCVIAFFAKILFEANRYVVAWMKNWRGITLK